MNKPTIKESLEYLRSLQMVQLCKLDEWGKLPDDIWMERKIKINKHFMNLETLAKAYEELQKIKKSKPLDRKKVEKELNYFLNDFASMEQKAMAEYLLATIKCKFKLLDLVMDDDNR